MSSSNNSSRRKLIVVLSVAGIVLVLAIISAFVWPGWALNRNSAPTKTAVTAQKAPAIPAKPLPANATALLKAMPDTVLDFARQMAQPNADWSASAPLEAYSLTYATGQANGEIQMKVAQWSSAESAKKQYDVVAGALQGNDLVSGKIQANSKVTGEYIVRTLTSDKTQATALWQNDTVVFEATGNKQALERFYRSFPM